MEDMEQIYREYMPQVYKYLFSLCHDRQTAEELTQETFYQAVKSINRFRGECKLYLPRAQVDETALIRKVSRKGKRMKRLAILVILVLCVLLAGSVVVFRPSKVDSSEVELLYGRVGNTVYAQMNESKNRTIQFTGSVDSIKDDKGNSIGQEMYLKTLTSVYSPQKGGESRWEDTITEDNQIVRWIFELVKNQNSYDRSGKEC